MFGLDLIWFYCDCFWWVYKKADDNPFLFLLHIIIIHIFLYSSYWNEMASSTSFVHRILLFVVDHFLRLWCAHISFSFYILSTLLPTKIVNLELRKDLRPPMHVFFRCKNSHKNILFFVQFTYSKSLLLAYMLFLLYPISNPAKKWSKFIFGKF